MSFSSLIEKLHFTLINQAVSLHVRQISRPSYLDTFTIQVRARSARLNNEHEKRTHQLSTREKKYTVVFELSQLTVITRTMYTCDEYRKKAPQRPITYKNPRCFRSPNPPRISYGRRWAVVRRAMI